MKPLAETVRVNVWPARPQDVPYLLPHMREFSKFASEKWAIYPGDEHALKILDVLVRTQPFFLAWKGNEIIGMMASLVTPHIFNPTITVLTELFWWVAPSHRGTRAGLLLLDKMMHWAEKSGIHIFNMTLEHHSPINIRTLEKRGFKLREHNFTREF